MATACPPPLPLIIRSSSSSSTTSQRPTSLASRNNSSRRSRVRSSRERWAVNRAPTRHHLTASDSEGHCACTLLSSIRCHPLQRAHPLPPLPLCTGPPPPSQPNVTQLTQQLEYRWGRAYLKHCKCGLVLDQPVGGTVVVTHSMA